MGVILLLLQYSLGVLLITHTAIQSDAEHRGGYRLDWSTGRDIFLGR